MFMEKILKGQGKSLIFKEFLKGQGKSLILKKTKESLLFKECLRVKKKV